MTTDTPSIYVASLTDYNAGRLHGTWIEIDTDTTEHDVWDPINAMLAKSPAPDAEEIAIHDADGFAGWAPDEHTPIETVVAVAHAMYEHDSEAVAAWIDYQGEASPETLSEFQDAYVGCWDSEADFVQEHVSEIGWYSLTPDQVTEIAYCLDWDAIARDLFIDDYWSERGAQGVHIFHRT